MMPYKKVKLTEGYLVRDINQIIFDVKGLVHPPDKVVAFPRFFPDSMGDRRYEDVKYKKVYTLSTRFEVLGQKFPQYIVHDSIFDEKLCEVPLENIDKHYNPVKRLQELRQNNKPDNLEACALEFFSHIKEYTKILWSKIGISGSLLVKLHTPNSDIDPVIYGTENCQKVYEALKALQQNAKSNVKSYQTRELQKLYKFRFPDTHMPFEDFVRTESRKVLQGKFKGRDYFMRFVKDWSEIQEKYGTVQYRNVGYARIKAEIEDDSEAILTPCSYKLKDAEVIEGARSYLIDRIASFRGRFCEQAKTGEKVIAQGKVEHVVDTRQNREYFRLLLGNKPSDFMVLA